MTDDFPSFLAIFALIVLAAFTVEQCRRDPLKLRIGTAPFLFQGYHRLHSFASALGSMFSVTYFAGGVIVFGSLLGGWYWLGLAAVFLFLPFLLNRIVTAISSSNSTAVDGLHTQNVLLAFLKNRLPRQHFLLLLWLYALIYLALVAEELAVSRLVLTVMFPGNPILVAAMILILCATVLVYLRFGGFRAVLISDNVQLAVLACFSLILLYLSTRSTHAPSYEPNRLTAVNILGLLSGLPVFIAWFTGGLDIFARLNYEDPEKRTWLEDRKRFLLLSLFGLFILVSLGVLFGARIPIDSMSSHQPVPFTEAVVEEMTKDRSPIILMTLFVSLFCMVFTTIDTLLIAVLQLGWHGKMRSLSVSNLSVIVAITAVFSSALPLNSVSAVGIFLASLLTVPTALVYRHVFFPAHRFTCVTVKSMVAAAILATCTFGFLYDYLVASFARQYLISFSVFASMAVACAGCTIYKRLPWATNS